MRFELTLYGSLDQCLFRWATRAYVVDKRAQGWIRTTGHQVRNLALYPLSYPGGVYDGIRTRKISDHNRAHCLRASYTVEMEGIEPSLLRSQTGCLTIGPHLVIPLCCQDGPPLCRVISENFREHCAMYGFRTRGLPRDKRVLSP